MYFSLGSPFALLLLLLLPCFWWCKPYSQRYYFPKLTWIAKQHPFLSIEPWLKMALFSLMVFALATPFVYDSKANTHKKGRDLILVIDASGSMAQRGFDTKERFKTKYETTLDLSKSFINKRFDDNIGVVIFGTFAYTASPLTYDVKSLGFLLDMTHVGLAGESTAIGDALMQSLRTLSYGDAKNKAIILLTDGYHNAGKHSPKEAVGKLKALGIRIYTIGIGEPSQYDGSLLHTIAKQTNAKSFHATSSSELSKIYEEINTLEPSPIRSERYLNQRLLILYPLCMTIFILLFWVFLAMRSRE